MDIWPTMANIHVYFFSLILLPPSRRLYFWWHFWFWTYLYDFLFFWGGGGGGGGGGVGPDQKKNWLHFGKVPKFSTVPFQCFWDYSWEYTPPPPNTEQIFLNFYVHIKFISFRERSGSYLAYLATLVEFGTLWVLSRWKYFFHNVGQLWLRLRPAPDWATGPNLIFGFELSFGVKCVSHIRTHEHWYYFISVCLCLMRDVLVLLFTKSFPQVNFTKIHKYGPHVTNSCPYQCFRLFQRKSQPWLDNTF